MPDETVYAAPRSVHSLADCNFYHSMDIPGHGVVEGLFDLRPNISRYFGGVDFKGKRVLEIGSASGYCTFHMERQGAEVVAYDLSEKDAWDVVPFASIDHEELVRDRQRGIRQIHNSFWLTHGALGSRARVVYGSCYAIPAAIGPVDIAVFGAVLLHLRDPFLALERALRLTRETVVITEPISTRHLPYLLLSAFLRPQMAFYPDFRRQTPTDAWWFMPPKLVKELIGVLGFDRTETRYHYQWYRGRRLGHYTVVGRRSRPRSAGGG